jgi:hypothetical protein
MRGWYRRSRPRRGRLSRALWIVVPVLLAVVLGAAVWVAARGWLAKNELQAASSLPAAVEHDLVQGNTVGAQHAARQLVQHADRAASLTSDPVWRGAEVLPWVGPNLVAVREAAAVTDDVAVHVLSPLTALSGDVTVASLTPHGGRLNLAPLQKAAPVLSRAQGALARSQTRAHAIKTVRVIPAVASAVQKLTAGVDDANDVVNAAANAATLLPGMLGADGPRDYLLLFQNPAELRATGGIAGAMALLHAEGGRLTLAAEASTADFPPRASAVMPLNADTAALYGSRPARHVQDVNMTPDFTQAAPLAARMWQDRFGTKVDGVVAIDPVVLGYLLKATGPVRLPNGDVLTSKNAVPLLLNEVYKRYSDPAEQDAYFASAAVAVFTDLLGADTQRVRADPAGLVRGLVRAGAERRILVWSAHPGEQKVLGASALSGALPTSTKALSSFGVYFNDATGSKMDYYLTAKVGTGARVCRADGRAHASVSVTLTNTAPTSLEEALPAYIAGPLPDVAVPRHVNLRVAVYAPIGSRALAVSSGDAAYPANASVDQGRTVAQFAVDLAPGASRTVELDFLLPPTASTRTVAMVTPALSVSSSQLVAVCHSK